MSIAGRHGKLSLSAQADDEAHWKRQEDLLTADVFGAYRYLPCALGILPLLEVARDENGERLGSWLASNGVALASLTSREVRFWPKLGTREADALLLLSQEHGACAVAVLVEAKLHASQHEIDGLSQLGFYARTFAKGDVDADTDLPPLRLVLYVTKAVEPPLSELARARAEVLGAASPVSFFWVGWPTALECATRVRDATGDAGDGTWDELLDDLIEDLRARGVALRRASVSFPMPPLAPLPVLSAEQLPDLVSATVGHHSPRAVLDLGALSLPRAASVLSTWRLQ